jgi:predicted extracellular nuclease
MKKIISVLIFNLLFSAFAVAQQLNTPINVIQGDGGMSPRVSQQVSTRGIVTAIVKKGFYIQTPDAEIDKSSKTSEGIYVFTDRDEIKAKVGDLVEVSGNVSEYKPRAEKYTLPITELIRNTVKVVSSGNPLPAPITLTAIDIDPKGSIEQLERYEGMRVKINSLTVSAGTSGRIDDKKTFIAYPDGTFFGVLSGTPRPMKEAGLDIIDILGEKLPRNILAFDMNPENLRFDSNEQINRKQLHVAAGEVIKNIVGVVDFGYRKYTILIDSDNKPTVENKKSAVPIPAAKDRQVTVGSFNLENFFDDEQNSDASKLKDPETVLPKEVFAGRLNKASLAIRNVLSMPDVLGIVECENIKVLKKLADKINADATNESKLCCIFGRRK